MQVSLVKAIGLTTGWAWPGSVGGLCGILGKRMSPAPNGDEVIVPGSFLWLTVIKHTQQVPAMT